MSSIFDSIIKKLREKRPVGKERKRPKKRFIWRDLKEVCLLLFGTNWLNNDWLSFQTRHSQLSLFSKSDAVSGKVSRSLYTKISMCLSSRLWHQEIRGSFVLYRIEMSKGPRGKFKFYIHVVLSFLWLSACVTDISCKAIKQCFQMSLFALLVFRVHLYL